MRAIGAAERALELMCERADERETFGKPVSSSANIRDWIAEARIELEMARLLVLKTAWLMDTVGNQHARIEIAGDQGRGAEDRLQDHRPRDPGARRRRRLRRLPAGYMYAHMRTLRLADGPDEVHKLSVARRELRRQRERRAHA